MQLAEELEMKGGSLRPMLAEMLREGTIGVVGKEGRLQLYGLPVAVGV